MRTRKKLQVFISSTYSDMREERQAAVEAVLRAGHIPAGMELFAAGSESQMEVIRRWIDDSDVFMLILGGRYGSLEPTSGRSYIELEYEYASTTKKPLFAVVISPDYLEAKVKETGTSAVETDHGSKLKAFRDLVASRICRFFSDRNELKLVVLESLLEYERTDDLVGWVRADAVIDAKLVLEEVSRLQAENDSLHRQVKNWEELQERQNEVSLGDDAKHLLIEAAGNDGRVLYLQVMGGSVLQAGNRDFIEPKTPREEARWKAALGELVSNGLVEPADHKGEMFEVSKRGYDLADEMRKVDALN